MEPDNVLVLFLAVHLHKQKLFQTDEQSEPPGLEVGARPAPVQQAQSREEFCRKLRYRIWDSINVSELRGNHVNTAT